MTTMLIMILKETFMALIGKIAFKAIIERAVTRSVLSGLDKLSKMSTNSVVKATITDIKWSLSNKGLAVLDGKK